MVNDFLLLRPRRGIDAAVSYPDAAHHGSGLSRSAVALRRALSGVFEVGTQAQRVAAIFGEKGDRNLLGVTTLEALEQAPAPFQRDFRALTLSRTGASPFR